MASSRDSGRGGALIQEVSMAKHHVANALRSVVDRTVPLHGVRGTTGADLR
jgi:alkylation response protein AidB-like acyl-CoA dehydrogenase